MTATPSNKLQLLEPENIQNLSRVGGPCVTIKVPGFHPGESAGTRAALLRQLAQKAEADLGEFSRSRGATEAAAAINNLIAAVDEGHGGPGLTLFCAPGFEAAFLTPQVTEQTTVGNHFHLVPVIRVAKAAHDICVLGISQKRVCVWRATSAGVTEVALPAGVPASLEAAGGYDRPDHTLENRSASAATAKRGIRFGTMSDHDDANEYLHKFMLLIAQGVRAAFRNMPIFLIGVREDLLEFRSAAKDAAIFDAEWHTNPEHCSLAEVEAHARAGANHEYYKQGEAKAAELAKARTRVLKEPMEILTAAREGRIHQVFVAEHAGFAGDAPPESGVHRGEDLLNLAVVEAMAKGAEVWTFPGTSLAAAGFPESAIAATPRY
ncbi:MAG: hypothetical protein ABL967_17650 [Bryobacteraceae bacterium]